MKLYVKQTDLFVPYDAEDVFAFFADAQNLQMLTPPWLDFRITTPRPIRMYVGRTINYRLHLRGLPIGWRTLISKWQPPHLFVDECVRGPYRVWHHEHRFIAEPGGTRVQDQVTYGLPLGPIGRLAHALFVKRDIDRIFAYRQARLREVFPSSTPAADRQPTHIPTTAARRSAPADVRQAQPLTTDR